MGFASAALLVACALLLFAALHDLAFRTIPDFVSLSVAACGLAVRLASGQLAAAALASVLVFAGAFLCWRYRVLGGGDVKLLAASSLLLAPAAVPMLLARIAIAGSLLTLPYLAARQRLVLASGPRPSGLAARILRTERRRLRRGGPLPYAIAIAAGCWSALLAQGVS